MPSPSYEDASYYPKFEQDNCHQEDDLIIAQQTFNTASFYIEIVKVCSCLNSNDEGITVRIFQGTHKKLQPTFR